MDKDENIKKGKSMLEQSAKNKEVDLKRFLSDKILEDVFARYSLKNLDDMYAMIGCGAITTTQVLNRMITLYTQFDTEEKDFVFKPITPIQNSEKASSISELGSMLVKYAKCCNPVPGDDIVGFISRGRGVTIHRSDCKALKSLDADRLMSLSWNDDGTKNSSFVAGIRLVVKNTSGMLAGIANKVAEQKINITSISSKNLNYDKTIVDVHVSVSSKSSLDDLMNKLKGINDVYEVSRGENI